MKKTENYFVISNYNYDPRPLLGYCNDYVIYDQSSGQKWKDLLVGANFVNSKHTGHNISDYFRFFIDNYENLPERIALVKGNIYPRHLTKDYFDKVYDNKYYTFLFDRVEYRGNNTRAYFLFSESEYLEYNNSWFVKEHPHWYFQSYNDILSFIYKDPVFPRYNLYSPGACYIVTKEQVLKNTKQFYENILKLIGYTVPVNPFPSEAHQIEWLCHTIYTSNYEVQDYMNGCVDFDAALTKLCESKKVSRKALDFLLKGEGAVQDLGANDQFIKASRASFERVRAISSAKILIIGVHSWHELEYWSQAFPKAMVLGAGILDLPARKEGGTSPQYVNVPLSRILEVSSIRNCEFDLIVYEGYHLKLDVEILSALKESHLGVNGEMYVFDVLSIPTGAINQISKRTSSSVAAYLVKCIPIRYEDNAGKYLIVVKKYKFNLMRAAYSNVYNKLQAFYYGIQWGRRNMFEYLKRRLPV